MQLGLHKPHYSHKDEKYMPIYNRRRFTHTWVLGKSGVGKSTALVNWALQDIMRGDGIAFFDPHGERTLSTLNKIGALISDPAIRNSIGQSRTALDLKDIIDKGRILIVRLPQGQLGIEKASLIGALLMSNIHLTALQKKTHTPFHIYADECHHFGNQTLIEMLSGIRKFGVALVLAHQYLDQLSPQFRAALLGIVGTIVSFRLGAADAKFLAPEFQLSPQDDEPLQAIPPYHAYASVNGRAPLLKMIPTDARQYPSSPKKVQNRCRSEYATPRSQVEDRIERFIRNT